ncbi:MAG: aldehyde dehydrogenase family protein, partial [Microbacterium sp.]
RTGTAAGVRLLEHPEVRAAAFTGSTPGGRALFDIANRRPVPIPFYGELGSLNPVYVSREAMSARAAQLVSGFVDSYTLGAGQLCTKPGLVFVPKAEGFAAAALERVQGLPATRLLNDRIADSYTAVGDLLSAVAGVEVLSAGGATELGHAPALLATTIDTFLQNAETLTTERFGPSALVVEYDDVAQLAAAADAVGGTLTSTVHAEHVTDAGIADLLPAAVRQSGRIIWNGWPTGVTVSPAMMHGGPYPAATSPLHTSVGLTAISRFLRPVVFQGFPDEALPAELKEANPLGLARSVDILRD